MESDAFEGKHPGWSICAQKTTYKSQRQGHLEAHPRSCKSYHSHFSTRKDLEGVLITTTQGQLGQVHSISSKCQHYLYLY